MQFKGKIRKINLDSVEIVFDESENIDVVLAGLSRLASAGDLLTIYADYEHRITKMQKEKIKSLIFDIVRQANNIPDEARTPEVIQSYLKKRFSIDSVSDLMKEEASMLIQSIKEFAEENGFHQSGATEDQSQLIHHVNVSNRNKTCIKCGAPGETFELKDFQSRLITEFRMGYRFITLCDKHYIEVLDTGISFFKNNHIIILRN